MLLGILLAAVIVVCIALVGVILLQRSEGGVLGMSGGGPGNFMSARGTGDLLTTTTQVLAGVFFALCLIMTLVTGHIRRENALASSLKNLSITPGAPASSAPTQTSAAQTAMAPGAAAPVSGAAPAPVRAPSSDGLNLFGNAAAPGARVPAAPKPVVVQPPPVAPKAAAPQAPAAKPAPVAKPVVKKPAASSAKPAASAPPAASSAPAAAPEPAAPPPAAAAAPATAPANN